MVEIGWIDLGKKWKKIVVIIKRKKKIIEGRIVDMEGIEEGKVRIERVDINI